MNRNLIYIIFLPLLGLTFTSIAYAYSCGFTPGPACASFSSAIGSGIAVNDVSTVSSTEVWVVGSSCKVAKFDGSAWVNHSASITGCSSATLNGVSASTSTNVWIGGNSGVVWKYTGSSWTSHTPGVGTRWATSNINAVSVFTDSGTEKVWVAGDSGHVWKYNGTSWSQESGGWGATNINSVSYLSSSESWIAGDNGHVWENNSGTWTQHSGTGKWGTNKVNEVSAYTTTSVFIVTDNGEVWEHDGDMDSNNDGTANDPVWTQHSGTGRWTTNALKDISDRYSTEVWVAGASGKVFELNPPKWTANTTATTVTVNGVVYTRSLYLQNVCRDDSTGNITVVTDTGGTAEACTGSPSGDSWDPSTLKITTTVSWAGGEPLTTSEYITRWKNSSCTQTAWSTSGVTDPRACPTVDYSTRTNISGTTSLTMTSVILSGTGTLTSTALDTTDLNDAVNSGPSYNSVMWLGSKPGTSNTSFQMAASDCPNGKGNAPTCNDSNNWTYYSAACAVNTWTNLGNSNTPTEIKCPTQFNSKRFFSYKLQLCANTGCTTSLIDSGPTVDDVIVNWNP
ncbi:MAG: hypothetical protein A3B23_03040 [Candidatus Colwellbacteria bacterium RIFCSPLOWO2_01_FULL_48_10]|uniref:Uncharacterized protein n=1 Tax=Candidatus Colwellbacteria bacterium RIFCSPLOWO2_01_FULL_48_10 TaxID=1797690 RepID=A0A1G1Z608_9BACT|nr:MAG: hypothetical protein A3B23_03040 [Candidatus Colwellbacteria bacterium RIFCSPLOWO2_01_FULL_48_10]